MTTKFKVPVSFVGTVMVIVDSANCESAVKRVARYVQEEYEDSDNPHASGIYQKGSAVIHADKVDDISKEPRLRDPDEISDFPCFDEYDEDEEEVM